MKNFLLGIIALLVSRGGSSQDTTKACMEIGGYVEIYYQYDFNKPGNNLRPGFIYSHNRHNEFNLNIGVISVKYEDSQVRAKLALGAGTYMNANYAAEPGVLKNVFEANVGFRLSKRRDLWLEGGIFSSHIGFESALGKDCWNLTRSILADNSPYYEAGARISYTSDNGKWFLLGTAMNGWQRIARVSGNSQISWGAQVQFRKPGKFILNYSNFVGTDKPDSAGLTRVFHNFYGIVNFSERFGLTLGLDLGSEEQSPTVKSWNYWYSPVIILKWAFNERWAAAVRGEYYSDPNEVIISTGSPHGFRTSGFSLNIDYSPAKNAIIRMEARRLTSRDRIFTRGMLLRKEDTFITSSIAVSF